MLTETTFKAMIADYCPLSWEKKLGSSGHYLEYAAYRYYRMFDFINGKEVSTAVDVGCFPGTLIRLLRMYCPNMHIYGIGLGLEDMKREMEDNKIEIFTS